MRNRHRRVLWLLNHKTLMAFEARLLVELGYEVFVPKVIPTDPSFRSGAVSFEYDSSLSLPAKVLERLNGFDFYKTAWPPDIVALINRYFGTVFVIPHELLVQEAVRKFEGRIMMRAFGLATIHTYVSVLEWLHGPGIFADIAAVKDRFWFAAGYEYLSENEPALFSERQVYLPIGLPDSYWQSADTYTGTDRRILFLCPNLVTSEYYAALYRRFKADFGDLPHTIYGAQDIKVDDPNVVGFVSDAELMRLHRDCAVFYYGSREPRHVHYSPIETAINGMPVIYYGDSLLGRMTPEVTMGRVSSVAEARRAIERILAGDKAFTDSLRANQRVLPYRFSEAYCRPVWRKNLDAIGFDSPPEPPATVFWRELRRTMLRPWARGLSTVPKRVAPPPQPPFPPATAQVVAEEALPPADVIDLTQDDIDSVRLSGLSWPESFGRWSTGRRVVIETSRATPRRFALVIEGGAFGPNLGAPIRVRIGSAVREFTFNADAMTRERVALQFVLSRPAHRIEISVPHPVRPPNDSRDVGLSLFRLSIEDLETFAARQRMEAVAALVRPRFDVAA